MSVEILERQAAGRQLQSAGDVEETQRSRRRLRQAAVPQERGAVALDGDLAGDRRQGVGAVPVVVGRGELVGRSRGQRDGVRAPPVLLATLIASRSVSEAAWSAVTWAAVSVSEKLSTVSAVDVTAITVSKRRSSSGSQSNRRPRSVSRFLERVRRLCGP